MYVTSLFGHRVICKVVDQILVAAEFRFMEPASGYGANEGPRARISRRCKLVCMYGSHTIYATGWACCPPPPGTRLCAPGVSGLA
ncbi:hypothetical protein C2E23DRAFT_823418, partial [Lenzites betulinus]